MYQYWDMFLHDAPTFVFTLVVCVVVTGFCTAFYLAFKPSKP